MKVRRNMKSLMLTGIASVITIALFSLCSKDQVVSPALNDTWKITGDIQDGYNGTFIDSALVTYANRDGKITQIASDKSGSFTCINLPYGDVTLTIQQSMGTVHYTTSVLTIASGPKTSALNDTATNTVKFRDTSIVVKLFPIGGSVADTVLARKHDLAPALAGASLQVKVTYGDSSMIYASPRVFSAVTDNNGYFRIDSLPLAPDAQLTILSGAVGGVNFAQKVVPLSDLVSGKGTVGTVVLDTPLTEMNASTKFRELFTNFPTKQVLPNGTMTWTCSGAPDSVVSYAVIQNAGPVLTKSKAIQNVTVSVSANTFNVTPTTILNNNQKYFVSVFVYGANGGSFKDTATVTVQGAGKEEVAVSNVLTATKDGISGLGLTDSIYFTLLDAVDQVTASVQHGDTIDLVTTSQSDEGKTVIITPKGSWLAGTKYTIKVFGMLSTGTPLSFSVVVTTEGALNFATSNVFDPNKPSVGKNGFIVSDPILITANKPLSAASAILSTGGVQVPVKVTVTNANVVVTPQNILNFNTSYLFQFSMSSATGEVKSDSVSFTTTSSGFYLVSSNACIGGDQTKPVTEFDPSAAIMITMSDSVASVSASLMQGSTSIAVTSVASGLGITVTPTTGALSQDSAYSLTVNASSVKGVKASVAIANFKTRSSLYPVWTNVRIGNDPSKPVLDFDPLSDIIVVMSNSLVSATAQVNSGAVPATITIMGRGQDTVVIHPQSSLPTGGTDSVSLFAQASDGTQYSGIIVTGLQPVTSVFVVASNVLTQDMVSLQNVSINTAPWFKMSVAPVASTIRATVTGTMTTGAIDNVVTVNSDTLVITPKSSFHYGEVVTVAFNGMAVNGKAINVTKSFTCEPAKIIRVVWSNVLNSNLDGLTSVPVNNPIKVLLSASPKAGSIIKSADVGPIGNAVITLSGDTIIMTPVSNLNYQTSYSFSLLGTDVNGNSFNVAVPPSGSFTTSQNVFVVASNLIDANGYPIQTFDRYGAMWIKFSEALATDKNKLAWAVYNAGWVFIPTANALSGPADVNIVGEGVAVSPNSTVRISNDTLFVTPDNRAAIGFNQKVGFMVTVMTATGKMATFAACVKTSPVNLFVKATNTMDANGVMRSDFGYLDPVWVVSSVQLDSIIAVNNTVGVIPDASAGFLKSRVRLVATGDTIFYTPNVSLAAGTQYGLTFDVHIKAQPKGTNNAGALGIQWKTNSGVQITSMNLMSDAATYRSFKVMGDSVVVAFSKAINTLTSAPTPFKVNGIGAIKYTTTWSADNKTVTIKNIDTLSARTYSVSNLDYNANLTTYPANYTLTFDVTCADGEVKAAVAGANTFVGPLAIKTEYALQLVGSSILDNHTALAAVIAGEAGKDTFALTGTPSLVFNRAIDSVKIKADAGNQYQKYLDLVSTAAPTVPLQFTVAFSADAKTITVTPVSLLIASQTYDLVIKNIPAIGIKETYSGAGIALALGNRMLDNTVHAYDFKAIPAALVDISALKDSILVDTLPATSVVAGNRYGYSSGALAGLATIQADGVLKVRVIEAAWNAKHADSVTFYQFRVRSSASSDWYIMSLATCAASCITGTYNPFDPNVNTTSRTSAYTLNLSAQSFYANLLVPDADGAGTNYTNGANMFNGGTTVLVEGRAVKDLTGGNYSYGAWSSTPISFGDNVAPGDSDYTVAVGYATTPAAMKFNNTLANINVGNNADSTQYISVTFLEDMNTTINPKIFFYTGTSSVVTPIPAAAGNSYWVNARTYRLYVLVPANQDFSTAGAGAWYFSVSTFGMKDYNGNALQGTGSIGTAANGVLVGAVTGAVAGNANVGNLHVCLP